MIIHTLQSSFYSKILDRTITSPFQSNFEFEVEEQKMKENGLASHKKCKLCPMTQFAVLCADVEGKKLIQLSNIFISTFSNISRQQI